MFKTLVFTPALTPILRDRKSCLAIAIVAGTHATLTAFGLPSWQCPVRYGLGLPCPGCGLSRAVVALGHGQWHEAVTLHAFAPLLIIGLMMILISGLLPAQVRDELTQGVERLERKTGLIVWVLISLVLYWWVRLLFFTEDFYQLVM